MTQDGWIDLVKQLTALATAVGVVVIAVLQYLQRGKVEQVRTELAQKHDDTSDQLADVAKKVEEVHRATNSMKDQLVAKTDEEAFARGAKSETDKRGAT